MKEFLESLKDPDASYRSAPFWSWNDRLEPEELRRQIREMKDAGIGGYFMHARGGLETPYMGDEWMKCIDACIDEGKKTGTQPWFYDEDGWPSGFAGGAVTALGEEYHIRNLVCGPAGREEGQVIGYYAVRGSAFRPLGLSPSGAAPDEAVLYVAQKVNPYYVDLLSPKVVDAFIKSTHEKYYARNGKDFGNAIFGFFTDEPQFARSMTPWSLVLPDEFYKDYGYDITGNLILLFMELDGYEAFRSDFWRLVSRLYVGSFLKKIYDWCEEHHCKLTGHLMMEENLVAQMSATAGVMPGYAYMHQPGMDWLCRSIGTPVPGKQLGSVAAQLGKSRVLTESFALCGWDVSFEELRWIAGWQYVNGVNWLCQHLEGYTIRGCRKRDYPACLFHQSPWWDEYRGFNDYFARLGKLLSDGRDVCDALLIHPLHSAWAIYNCDKDHRAREIDLEEGAAGKAKELPRYSDIRALNRAFESEATLLAELHIGVHYGDEDIMRDHGRVDNGLIWVGRCAYKTVFLPTIYSIDRATLELLTAFLNQGGRIAALGRLPVMVDGRPAPELAAFNARVEQYTDKERVLKFAFDTGLIRISVAGNNGEEPSIHYCERELPGRRIWYLVNLDKDHGVRARITIPSETAAAILDLEELKTLPVACDEPDCVSFMYEFAPAESLVLVTGEGVERAEGGAEPKILLPLSRNWDVNATDPGCLTLDYCEYRLDEGLWQASMPLSALFETLLAEQKNRKLTMRFGFEVRSGLQNFAPVRLVAELPEQKKITVNGQEVRFGGDWWKDKSFKTADVTAMLKDGPNEIIIETEFYQRQKVYDVLFGKDVLETEKNKLTYDTELESIYLTGNFGVYSDSAFLPGERRALFTDGPFYLAPLPKRVRGGGLTKQGWLFFAGTVTLSQKIMLKKGAGRTVIRFVKPHAVLCELSVNGKRAKTFLWGPYEADVTDLITDGENVVTLRLISGNRNLLGPHHLPGGESYGVGPGSFAPHGEMTPERWRHRYCFVRFGVDD